MIVLSEKTLGLIKTEAAKPHVQSAVSDKTLSAGHFSTELHTALAEDARVDGTGATMIPQIVSLVAQLIELFYGVKPVAATAVPK